MSSTLPVVTLAAVAVLALLGSILAILVIVARVRLKVEWGDGGNMSMAQTMRAHANFSEYVPLALLTIGACELVGTPRTWVIGLTVALVMARVLSALGLSRSLGPSIPRQAGASTTIAVTIVAAVAVLWMIARQSP